MPEPHFKRGERVFHLRRSAHGKVLRVYYRLDVDRVWIRYDDGSDNMDVPAPELRHEELKK